MSESRFRDRTSQSTATSSDGFRTGSADGPWKSGYPVTTTRSWPIEEWMTDSVTTGFRRKSNAGLVFNNPMKRMKVISSTLRTLKIWSASNSYPNDVWVTGAYGISLVPTIKRDMPGDSDRFYHPTYRADLQRCESVAATEAYAGVGSPDAETLTSLAELPETFGFLLSPVKSMTNLIKRHKRKLEVLSADEARYQRALTVYNSIAPSKRGSRRPPKRAKREFTVEGRRVTDVASFWMAFRYGLMPLVYDFQDHWKAFNKAIDSPARETSRGKHVINNEIKTLSVGGPYGHGESDTLTKTFTYQVTSRAGVLYEPRVETTQSKYGLELHRVPGTLYELIPLSFVADWLWNFADVLNAYSADLRSGKMLAAWVKTKVEWSYEATLTRTTTQLGNTGTGRYYESGEYSFRRPINLLDVSLRLRLEMNPKRVADALALVVLFLRRK